jgi:hypothetical protein
MFHIIPIFLLVFALKSWQHCCRKGMAPYLAKMEIKIQAGCLGSSSFHTRNGGQQRACSRSNYIEKQHGLSSSLNLPKPNPCDLSKHNIIRIAGDVI